MERKDCKMLFVLDLRCIRYLKVYLLISSTLGRKYHEPFKEAKKTALNITMSHHELFLGGLELWEKADMLA